MGQRPRPRGVSVAGEQGREADEEYRDLKPGDFAEVRIVTEARAEAVLVPRGAVITEKGETVVFVAASADLMGSTSISKLGAAFPQGMYNFVSNPEARLLAAGITGFAIWLEATADQQLRRFTTTAHPRGEFLRSGLWAWCRHPNYLGEILFWWGLLAFSLAAGHAPWWAFLGAISMTVMFHVVSIPMIDRRMIASRPAYADHIERTPALLPRRPATD